MTVFQVTGGTLNLDLPPKTDCNGEAAARKVEEALTSVTAFHARALTTFTFYEVIDLWLGPWGVQGYPIGYGKFYNVRFTRSWIVQTSEGQLFIRTTTVALQDALKKYILGRVRQGTLSVLTEPELRQAAFDSHPQCYTSSGLARMVFLDPTLIPYIAAIPAKEFLPSSDNFGATMKQVLETVAAVSALSAALPVAYAMPAHSGYLRRAAAIDARRYRDMMTFGHRMEQVRKTIAGGGVDHVPVLNQIISELVRGEYRDPDARRVVSELVRAAEKRKTELLKKHESELQGAAPDLQKSIRKQLGAKPSPPTARPQ